MKPRTIGQIGELQAALKFPVPPPEVAQSSLALCEKHHSLQRLLLRSEALRRIKRCFIVLGEVLTLRQLPKIGAQHGMIGQFEQANGGWNTGCAVQRCFERSA